MPAAQTEDPVPPRPGLRYAGPVNVLALALALAVQATPSQTPPPALPKPKLSGDTKDCLRCHETATPGLVGDWRRSRHSQVTVRQALGKKELERRVSAKTVPEELLDVVVGCAECHTLNPESHPDTLEHAGFDVHPVVTPKDCAVCHPTETDEFGRSLMSQAYGNLANNPAFHAMADDVNMTPAKPDALTDQASCFACHGTKVEVKGKVKRKTATDEMEFVVLSGWPNQGVGRINPDGSKGACTACHTRHQFSIEQSRKPEACQTCHSGPDVPAYPVYMSSKHGSNYATLSDEWNFTAVPWVPGKDFTAPTCATCHMSLLATSDGTVLSPRTHELGDRLPWRIFGLPYAHPHPKTADTTGFMNSAKLPLPTELTGEPVASAVIGPEEQAKRKAALMRTCRPCHGQSVIEGHFAQFERTLETTNAMTLEATKLMQRAWAAGVAKGPAQGGSPWDEPLERQWMEQWLFWANSTRFSSAMMGWDYGVFEGGRWDQSKGLKELKEAVERAEKAKGRKK